MKKVLSREPSNNMNEEDNINGATPSPQLNIEPVVRTTGRIKKPKAVFDPSDHYIKRANRLSSTVQHTNQVSTSSTNAERRASYTKTNISPVSSTAEPQQPAVWPKEACVVCKKRESKRPIFASRNRIISCLGCDLKIHKLCLKVDFEDLEYLQSHFKCNQCANCCICEQKIINPDEEIITCSKCVKSFHINCFPSKIDISEGNQRNWKCNKCNVFYNHSTNGTTTLPVKKIREIIGGAEPATQISPPKSTTTPPPTSNKTSPEANKNNENSETITSPMKRSHEVENKTEDSLNNRAGPPSEKRTKTSKNQPTNDKSLNTFNSSVNQIKSECFSPNEHIDIPDVKQWSVDQVYEYFLKHFPKEAHVFKDEEIDGRSLLLLKRSDVVKKLAIKLGPSLRIYSLILKIQAQLNDPTLGWNCGL